MAYNRYIKIKGKVYGPYEYSSHRKDGKVVSEYIGKGSKNIEEIHPAFAERKIEPVQKPEILEKVNEEEEVTRTNFKPFLIAGVLIFLIAAYLILPVMFTGKASVEGNEEVIADTEASEQIIVGEPTAEEQIVNEAIAEEEPEPINEPVINETIVEPAVNETEINITEPIANETITEEENITESVVNETLSENITEPEIETNNTLEFIEINESINLENVSEIITENATEIKVLPEKTLQYKVVLGEPVKWKKVVKLNEEQANSDKIIVDIPRAASNVDVGKIVDGAEENIDYASIEGKDAEDYNGASENFITGEVVLKIYKKNFFENVIEFIKDAFAITGRAIGLDIEEVQEIHENIEQEKVEVEIDDEFTEGMEIIIEYETPAPWAEETETKDGKQITINSIVHYQDILAFTEINDIPKDMISLYWITDNNREKVNEINYIDDNNDSLIDSIEWIVPSLSSQTYEIIIEISKAEHLDANREFISDIYEPVKDKDNVWSEAINQDEYVRVVFEQSLDSSKEITIYCRSNSIASIEIYEKDSNDLIAVISNISAEGYYKAYLAGLLGSQDTFDFKVLGSVEIDYVFDPFTITSVSFVSPSSLTNLTYSKSNWIYTNISSTEVLNQSLLEWQDSSGVANVTMLNSTPANTSWYYNETSLGDGSYNYTVWAQNQTGEWVQTERKYVIIDTTGNAASITSCATFFGDNKQYNLMQNPDKPKSNCFVINANNITLDCNNYLIQGNLSYYGVSATGHNYLTIKNCHINGSSTGISLVSANHTKAINNAINSTTYGIGLTSCSYVEIDNSVVNSSTNGISLDLSDYNNITNSYFNGTSYGVQLSSSNYNKINNVNASGSVRGIYIYISSYNLVNNSNASSAAIAINIYAAFPAPSNYNNITNSYAYGVTSGISIYGDGGYNRVINTYAFGTSTGMGMSYAFPTGQSNNNYVENSTIASNDIGLNICGTTYNQVIDSNIRGVEKGISFSNCLPVEFFGRLVTENSIKGCTISGKMGVVFHNDMGANNVLNNTIINSSVIGIAINNTANPAVVSNIVFKNYGASMNVQGVPKRMTNLTFNNTPSLLNIDFTYSGNVTIMSINSSTAPLDSAGLHNISKYFNVTNSTESSLGINISYTDLEIAGISESSLRLYRYNGTNWTFPNSSSMNSVDTTKNLVYANITSFSTFAILGLDGQAPIVSFACSPLSVDVGATITCTCTATDNFDSNPSVSYTTNPLTTTAGTFSTTCTATDNEGNSKIESISYTVNTPSGGEEEEEPGCTPNCAGKTCGDDGCAGSCGTCSAGYECSSGNCALIPPSCTDDCTSGAKECVTGTSFKICGNYDADACYEWGSSESCESGKTCQNGVCISETPTCSNDCSPSGKSECIDGISFQVCGNYDADSCLEWDAVTSCDINTEECSAGACVAKACISDWNCGEWSACEISYTANGVEGLQERSCSDLAGCEDEQTETQTCEIEEVDVDIEVEEVNGEILTKLSDPVSGGYIGTIKKGERDGKPYVDIILLEPLEGIPKRLKEIPEKTTSDYFKAYSKWIFLVVLLAAWMFMATFFQAYISEIMPMPSPIGMPMPAPKIPTIPSVMERMKEEAEEIRIVQKEIPEITLEGIKEKESRKIERKIKSKIKEFRESKEIEELKRQLQMIETELGRLSGIKITGIEHKIDFNNEKERIEKHLEKIKAKKIEIEEPEEMSYLEIQLKRIKESLMNLDKIPASDESKKIYDFGKAKEKIDRHIDKEIRLREEKIKESESIKELRHDIEKIKRLLEKL